MNEQTKHDNSETIGSLMKITTLQALSIVCLVVFGAMGLFYHQFLRLEDRLEHVRVDVDSVTDRQFERIFLAIPDGKITKVSNGDGESTEDEGGTLK